MIPFSASSPTIMRFVSSYRFFQPSPWVPQNRQLQPYLDRQASFLSFIWLLYVLVLSSLLSNYAFRWKCQLSRGASTSYQFFLINTLVACSFIKLALTTDSLRTMLLGWRSGVEPPSEKSWKDFEMSDAWMRRQRFYIDPLLFYYYIHLNRCKTLKFWNL